MINIYQLAALIAAIGFAALMLALAYVVFKLRKTADQIALSIGQTTDTLLPTLANTTVISGQVSEELTRVNAITSNVQSMTGNVSALTSLFAATLGSPVIKVAAFSYGVRRAAGKRHSDEVTKRVRSELKSERRGRR